MCCVDINRRSPFHSLFSRDDATDESIPPQMRIGWAIERVKNNEWEGRWNDERTHSGTTSTTISWSIASWRHNWFHKVSKLPRAWSFNRPRDAVPNISRTQTECDECEIERARDVSWIVIANIDWCDAMWYHHAWESTQISVSHREWQCTWSLIMPTVYTFMLNTCIDQTCQY